MPKIKNKTRRRRLFFIQNGLCHYCECRMNLEDDGPDSCTVDHKITRKRGGLNTRDNIVGACKACNNARGTKDYEVFRLLVKQRGRPNNSRSNPLTIHEMNALMSDLDAEFRSSKTSIIEIALKDAESQKGDRKEMFRAVPAEAKS